MGINDGIYFCIHICTYTYNMGINDGICMLPAGFFNCECHVGGEDYLLLLSANLITTTTTTISWRDC